jgi:RNA polymerase sigma-70 factor (ECF subfamily)
MNSVAETELTQAARAGDAVAFDALLDPLMEAGYRLAFTMLRDRQAAEDVVQEAAFKAWKKFHQLSGSLVLVRDDGSAVVLASAGVHLL